VVQMPTGYIADGTECFVCKSMGVTPCELQRPTDSNQCILQIFGVNLANLAIVVMSRNCLVRSEGIFGGGFLSLTRLSEKIYTLVQKQNLQS